MEEEDTKQCPNCKREIPAVNFTTHSVHCARNLRTCPVCKEPVPVAQLQEHHDALHKEVPCKKCGESVCGTDLEDHIRDSCAQTIKPCRYCELELPRSTLPAHENYCGARSEQCPDCREYVMLKYRQLHLQSNHGFIRLDEDPVPKEAKPKPVTNGFSNPSTSRPQNGAPRPDLNRLGPQTEIRYYGAGSSSNVDRAAKNVDSRASSASSSNQANRVASMDRGANSADNRVAERNGKVTVKRTNDQPQINTSVEPREKVHKEFFPRGVGAVKKRPAPPPPAPAPATAPAPDARRDLPFWSAQKRAQDEERQRRDQTAYNLSVGLPPVLSPAAKLDKLRKMDALHNREVEEDYSERLRGRERQALERQTLEPEGNRLGDLSNLQPMTAQQFMDRFQELQLGADRRRPTRDAVPAERSASSSGGGDRFSEIKSSLRELRRGLNEVTAPYNAASNATNNTHIDSNRLCPPSPPSEPEHDDGHGGVRLPCEFCGAAVPARDLVLHQVTMEEHGGVRLPCEFCGAAVPARDLVLHQVTMEEHGGVRLPCEFCGAAVPARDLVLHQVTMEEHGGVRLPCEFCGAAVPARDLVLHQVTMEEHGGVRLPCEFCGAAVPARDLVLHQVTMEEHGGVRLPCEFCGAAVPARDLVLHQVTMEEHGGVRLPCEFCGAAVPARDLVLHQVTMEEHGGVRLPCEFCGAAVPARDLVLHQVTMEEHGGVRLPCEFCGAAVPARDLVLHQVTMEEHGGVRLPCEFCGAAVPARDLVLHQTGCRPDLTQYRPKKSSSRSRSRSPRHPSPQPRRPSPQPRRPSPQPRPRTLSEMEEPVIPCEFCTESLPVYLISEHQERCRREANVLYPD